MKRQDLNIKKNAGEIKLRSQISAYPKRRSSFEAEGLDHTTLFR
jgi:hypothetical protein